MLLLLDTKIRERDAYVIIEAANGGLCEHCAIDCSRSLLNVIIGNSLEDSLASTKMSRPSSLSLSLSFMPIINTILMR